MPDIQTSPQPRVFYSRAANLILHPTAGQVVMQEGHVIRFGERMIEFSPIGDGYGRFVATDPTDIAYLERQMLSGGDVFDAATYNRLTTPAEVQIEMLRQENERLITEQNRLLAQLGQEGRLPSRAQR